MYPRFWVKEKEECDECSTRTQDIPDIQEIPDITDIKHLRLARYCRQAALCKLYKDDSCRVYPWLSLGVMGCGMHPAYCPPDGGTAGTHTHHNIGQKQQLKSYKTVHTLDVNEYIVHCTCTCQVVYENNRTCISLLIITYLASSEHEKVKKIKM